MEHQEVAGTGGLTKAEAVAACTAMAVFYVAILYSPTVLLRLPPPNSFKSFMIRRFACAAVSSVVSLFICSLILPVRRWDASNLFAVYGIRLDHIWQALVFPLVLTSFMYTGSFVRKFLSMLQESNEHLGDGGNLSNFCIKSIFSEFIDWAVSNSSNISSWRNYFVIALAATRDGIKDGDIPVWLLVLVLIRLPPKLIFRFKCVCKQWLSIISNPSFVRFYCSQALLLHPWTFISSHMQFDGSESWHLPDPKLLADIYSDNFDWPSLHLLSLPSFEQPYGKDYMIYGVSNGLVLYGPLEYHAAVVRLCNPLTGHFITLPPNVFGGQGWDSWGLVANVEDGILVSYIVVHLYVPFRRESNKIIQGEVFLSEIGYWKNYDVHFDMDIPFDPSRVRVYFHGKLHWLAR
ncbi:hypothetical protein RD792_014231 [Penstemon davidsonii]|uniref:F-box protein n=1 Tax=Penstemon davidsonii TaxID=160366 RepID=A0ABR0CR20_9LAMI|nr:hypothetical protein RD792_014231 [Penstemon davidsonii]